MKTMSTHTSQSQQSNAKVTDLATESVQQQEKNLFVPGITEYEPIKVGDTQSNLPEVFSDSIMIPCSEKLIELEALWALPHMKALLLGSLLGDMSIVVNPKTKTGGARIQCNHGTKQTTYAQLKADLLAPLSTRFLLMDNPGYGDQLARIVTLSHAALNQVRKFCYSKVNLELGRTQKYVTQEWVDQLTWEAVAWWIFDDGSLSKVGHSYTISTHSFSEEEVDRLVNWFHTHGATGVKRIMVKKRGKQYPVILMDAEASFYVAAHIAPYTPACMAYKVEMPALLYKVTCPHCQEEHILTRQKYMAKLKKEM